MREGLREVADEPSRAGVVLLGEQTEIVSQTEQALEDLARLGSTASELHRVRQPEAARQECTFSRGQPVVGRGRVVTHHKPVDEEFALDRCDRAADPGIVRRKKASRRYEKKARIERPGAIRLDEAATFPIEPALAHIGMYAAAKVAPPGNGALQLGGFNRPNTAVQRHPRHDLRMCEVLRPAARFPDALVGTIPDSFQVFQHRSLKGPIRCPRLEPATVGLIQRVAHFTEHVELQLLVRRVADADRGRTLVSRQPGNLVFRQAALAGKAIHDVKLRRRSGSRAQQPVPPRLRLVVVAGIHQRKQCERRIAQPTVAIVPVPCTAEQFRQ